jgi:hypothetical protein
VLWKPLLMLVQKATLAPATRAGIPETDTSLLVSGTMNVRTSTLALLPNKEDTARIALPMQPFTHQIYMWLSQWFHTRSRVCEGRAWSVELYRI